jgi:hypothetical protein
VYCVGHRHPNLKRASAARPARTKTRAVAFEPLSNWDAFRPEKNPLKEAHRRQAALVAGLSSASADAISRRRLGAGPAVG